MAHYNALTKMREINKKRYGIDGPRVPVMLSDKKLSGNLEKQCLKFIRESCEDLRFDKEDQKYWDLSDLDGHSVGPNQIPLFMERDIDRLCLENAIHRFMTSGSTTDAFDVYFCYLEMFVGNYKDSKKMIEMLAEFESNASSLLMKHRDHYSHSVYVFVLGLAIYQSIPVFRECYKEFYHLEDEKKSAHHYLKHWGMASLFHDIGYPFELPFEQVKSYFGNSIEDVMFISYKGLEKYTDTKCDKNKLRKFVEADAAYLADEKNGMIRILAHNLAQKLEAEYGDFEDFQNFVKKHDENGRTVSYEDYLVEEILERKPGEPEYFGGFIDHAFFSTVILMSKLMEMWDEEINTDITDVLTAILLHNSMYKFSVTKLKKNGQENPYNEHHHFGMKTHPLAYMLMLCDELQCWDRTSYGQNSRQEYHPMWCELEFQDNIINAHYYYDVEFSDEKKNTGTYKKMQSQAGSSVFLKDIEMIICVNEEGDSGIGLTIDTCIAENNRNTNQYISNSSFLHLYNFAISLNSMYNARSYDTKEWVNLPEKEMEEQFEKLSLEYKLSNIAQAEAFGKYLSKIGCFYTDRQVAYKMKREFSVSELREIGVMEHARWDEEKYSMGWMFGDAFIEKSKELDVDKKLIREQTRTHNDLGVPFNALSKTEQNKDTDPMNDMMKLIEKYDGLRVYQL